MEPVTLIVIGGAVAEGSRWLYFHTLERFVDPEKAAIRLRCRASMLEAFVALSKSRKEAKATVKAAKAAKPALAGA
jgi:hypothetical protein